MVCGLVEYQQIDVRAHEHTEPQAALLAAGERADLLERVLAREAEGTKAVARLLRGAAAVVYQRVQRRAGWVAESDDLRQVRHADARPAADPAGVRLLLADDQLHERALARAVVADDGHALAALDDGREAGKELAALKTLGEPVHCDDLVAGEVPLLERSVQLARLARALGLVQALNALFHGKGPLVQLVVAHEGPEVQPGGGLFKLLDLGLVFLVFFKLLLEAALALDDVKAVVAGVELRAPVHDLDAALGHHVEEIAVVADGQHRAAEVEDIVLQPLRGAQVEVVRRLVEQQDVRVLQYQPRQVDARLFPAGEEVELPLAHLLRDVEAVGHAVAFAVHVIAAQAAEIVAQAVVLVEQLRRAVALHLPLELGDARGHAAQSAVRLAQHVLRGPAGGVARYLRYQPDAPAAVDGDVATVLAYLAGEQAEERGLATAVGPEDAHALAGVYVKAESVQHGMAHFKGFFYVFYRYIYHFYPCSLCFSSFFACAAS